LLHEPPLGTLPAFTFFMQLHSGVALAPEGDFSSLVVVWFADALPPTCRLIWSPMCGASRGGQWARDGVY